MPPVRRSEAIALPHRHNLRPRGPLRRFTVLNSTPLCTHAEEDLRGYLKAAQLPTIARFDRSNPYRVPRPGRKTHKNKLKVRHDADRRLEEIRRADSTAFNDAVQKCKYISLLWHAHILDAGVADHKHFVFGRGRRPYAGKHYRKREGEALVLPAPKYIAEDTFADIPYPCSIDAACRWVVERPLQTMQRAVHLACPDTTRWSLDHAHSEIRPPNEDPNLWRTYVWRFHPDEHHPTWWRDADFGAATEPAPPESLVFAVQPHWILGPQDLSDVADCKQLPSFSDDGTPPEAPLTSHERVWARLHDTCKSHNCPTFALTNYHGWVFGTFIQDWTAAQISEVKQFDAKRPTLIQSLVYWVASSMGLAGASGMPDEEIDSTSEVSREI